MRRLHFGYSDGLQLNSSIQETKITIKKVLKVEVWRDYAGNKLLFFYLLKVRR